MCAKCCTVLDESVQNMVPCLLKSQPAFQKVDLGLSKVCLVLEILCKHKVEPCKYLSVQKNCPDPCKWGLRKSLCAENCTMPHMTLSNVHTLKGKHWGFPVFYDVKMTTKSKSDWAFSCFLQWKSIKFFRLFMTILLCFEVFELFVMLFFHSSFVSYGFLSTLF